MATIKLTIKEGNGSFTRLTHSISINTFFPNTFTFNTSTGLAHIHVNDILSIELVETNEIIRNKKLYLLS